jgi:hypothetical protein
MSKISGIEKISGETSRINEIKKDMSQMPNSAYKRWFAYEWKFDKKQGMS